MNSYYIVDADNFIRNRVIADSPEDALVGYPDCQAITTLSTEHRYSEMPAGTPDSLSRLSFMRRFTASERIAIRASVDPVIVDFMALLDLAGEVLVDDSDTQAGFSYLVAHGLLSAERAAEILSANP